MYTNYNSNLEKNQMMTPPIIGLTSSIVNDKLNNISLEDNSTGLFKIEDSKIKPLVEIPIETNNFIISGTDDEIDSNENNAVNKRYLINKITPLDNKFMTQAQCDNRYMMKDVTGLTLNELTINSSTGTPALKITTETLTGTTEPNVLFVYSNGSSTRAIMTMNNDRIYSAKPMAFLFGGGIQFNTQDNGNVSFNLLPQTILMGLVPSTINETQLSYMKTMLDCVCPTYQYCENTYAKIGSSGGSSTGSHTKYDLDTRSFTLLSTTINASQSMTDIAKMDIDSRVRTGWWNVNIRILFETSISIPSSTILSLASGLMFCLRRKTSNSSFQDTQLLGSSMGMYTNGKLEFRITGIIHDEFNYVKVDNITTDEFILSYSNTSSISLTNTDTIINWFISSPEQIFIGI